MKALFLNTVMFWGTGAWNSSMWILRGYSSAHNNIKVSSVWWWQVAFPRALPGGPLPSQPHHQSTLCIFWISNNPVGEICLSVVVSVTYLVEVRYACSKAHRCNVRAPLTSSEGTCTYIHCPNQDRKLPLSQKPVSSPLQSFWRWHSSDFYHPRFCVPSFWTLYKWYLSFLCLAHFVHFCDIHPYAYTAIKYPLSLYNIPLCEHTNIYLFILFIDGIWAVSSLVLQNNYIQL